MIRSVESSWKRTVLLKPLLAMVAAVGFGHAQNCTNAAASPSVCAYDAAKNAAAKTKIKGVLLYDWTVGGHDRSHTQNSMMRLSQKYGFRLDRSQSQTYITAQTLQGIDLIVFNNGDQDPLQNATSLQAVRNFVEKEGKGILVVHAGAAYIPCPAENIADANCRWIMRGLRTQFWIHNPDNTRGTIYADSVVAGQIPPRATATSAVASARNHGRKNDETRMIFENLPTNAGAGALANAKYIWEGLGDEWYNYLNNPRLEGQRTLDGVVFGPINILLSLDESSVSNTAGCNGSGNNCKNQGTFGDRPVSWTRKIGNGNIVYQNAGHSNVYTRQRVVGGANVNDSIVEKLNWRIMKYLARDFVGCMTPGDTKYNPEASVTQLNPGIDPASPCEGGVTTIAAPSPAKGSRISVLNGVLSVAIPGATDLRVTVTDLSGKSVLSRSARGTGGLEIPDLAAGRYIVKASGSGREFAETVEIGPW